MIPWDKLHGAMTHFPIALLMFSTACDFVSVAFKKLTFTQGLRLVSFYGLAFAALASVGAVVSGIALTKGDMWGRGDFGWHHRFVWPAFGLLVAFFQSCAHCHGQDADGGEDAPSLLKLQISGAHMALVIQSGIKDEMPSFAKKYNEQDTAAIVAYLKTLH